ncbi:chromo shadow domain-containing protein [Purpureocillium lilacinum]|uniref:Chromo shadow domain-containing protein n=1 Tax=Purpureocillium lilacinum TaxID=33203 RepID=A0A179F2Z1_PURLI|nr:chromo shadow domain-containing protein [Purpureocillium lilacinum]OAQ59798.1 chromo shadow domain-containing protein [Purpureocillium lilacinum]
MEWLEKEQNTSRPIHLGNCPHTHSFYSDNFVLVSTPFVMRTRSRAKVTKPVRSSTSRRQFLLAQETWEDLVAIDSMDTDAGGRLRVYIKTIDTGEVSAHDAAVTYAKCPQKMLRFYEKHICFI